MFLLSFPLGQKRVFVPPAPPRLPRALPVDTAYVVLGRTLKLPPLAIGV